MNISEADQNAIADKIVDRLQASCNCNIDPQAQGQMGHLFGTFRDEGDGDYAKGIELLRKVLQHFKRVDRITVYITRAVLTSAVLGVMAGIVKIIYTGIVTFIRNLSP